VPSASNTFADKLLQLPSVGTSRRAQSLISSLQQDPLVRGNNLHNTQTSTPYVLTWSRQSRIGGKRGASSTDFGVSSPLQIYPFYITLHCWTSTVTFANKSRRSALWRCCIALHRICIASPWRHGHFLRRNSLQAAQTSAPRDLTLTNPHESLNLLESPFPSFASQEPELPVC
jgi:hypothetical protein